MKLTEKLLGFLHRVFDKDPMQFLALRLSYVGGTMSWKVAEGVLTTSVVGGPGQNLTVDLANYTVRQLVSYLAAQPGYVVLSMDGSENADLSARVLLDDARSIDQTNGDHLYGYTNFLFSYLEAQAVELQAAEVQIGQALRQMNTQTAEGEWLDEHGSYLGVPRLQGETDGQYGPRMIAEILRPRGNNVAIEMAISDFTGQDTKVVDVTLYGAATPKYDATITENGARRYDASPALLLGLFDVTYGYDLLNGADVTTFRQTLTDLIGRLRDAGTHLRSLLLQSSAIGDAFPNAPTDGASFPLTIGYIGTDTLTAPTENSVVIASTMGQLSDPLTAPADGGSLTVTYNYAYSGLRVHDGLITHAGGTAPTESL